MKFPFVALFFLLLTALLPHGVAAAPAAPTVMAATSITQTGFSANWGAVSGAVGYRLDVATDSAFTGYVAGFNDLDTGNVTTYDISGLTAGTTYYYRVRAYDGTGVSLSSTTTVLMTLPPTPTAPASLTTAAVTQTGFTASWGAVSGAIGFQFDLSLDPSFGSFVTGYNGKELANVTSLAIGGLSSGTTYYFRLRAYNTGGISDNSVGYSQDTLPPTPAAPVTSAATSITQTGFTVNWGTVSGATGYRLDVSASSGFTTFITGFNNLDVANVTGYAVTGVSTGVTYYYRVRAYNSGGTSTNSTTGTVVTLPATPGAPVAAAATAITQSGFTANWGSVSGATGYLLDVATDSGFTTLVSGFNALDVANVTKLAVSGLASGTTYYYRLRAYNSGGTGVRSNVINLTTLPATPAAPDATAASSITQTGCIANWTQSDGATTYKFDLATDSAFGSFVGTYNSKDVGNVASVTISSLTAGTTYYYRVRAANSGGTSASSDTVVLITLPPSPAAPVATAATSVTQTGLTATWQSVSGATGYRLDVATNSAFSSYVTGFNNLDVGNVTSYPVAGLVTGTTYYYRVRGYNIGGTGTNSNMITQATLATPVAATATAIGQTGFTANWGSVAAATGYYLDVATDSAFTAPVSGFSDLDVGKVTSYSVTGLTTSTAYYYRVRSYTAAAVSANSNAITLTTQPPTPAVPVANAATTITATGFAAKWNSVSGATGYRFDLATDVAFTSMVTSYTNKDAGNVATLSLTGLTAGTTYYYRVRAYNTGGTSDSSNVISLTLLPAAPVAVTGSLVSVSGFTANWNGVNGALGYYLDVATSSSFTTYVTGFSNQDVGNVTSMAIGGLTAGSTYYYRVRAYSAGGTGANSNSITQPVLPLAPVASAATSVTQSGFSAVWATVSGATGYRLDVATDADFTALVTGYSDKNVGSVTTSAVSGLGAATTYYYRVRTVNGAGASINSNTIGVLTVPVAPVASQATIVTQTGFTANWAVVPGASGYRIDVSSSSGFSSYLAGFNNLDVTTATSASVTGLAAGGTYYYRVRAYNAGGSGVNSNVISQITLATPVATAATNVSQAGFSANWGAANSATGYFLDVATDTAFSHLLFDYPVDVGNVTSYSVSGLDPSTTYYYRVRSYNPAATSAFSNSITLTTLPPIPAAPAALAATAVTKTGFSANWSKVTGATGYRFDVATDTAFTTLLSSYNNKDVANVATSAVSGLTAGMTYYIRVRAYNTGGVSPNSNTITQATLPTTIPDVPVAAAASNVSTTGFTANWGAVSGADGYVIFVATDAAFTSLLPGYADKNVGNVTSYAVTGLESGTSYYYQVRAYNTAGTSALSNAIATAAIPVAPVASAAVNTSQSGFAATWGAVSGVTGYRLDVATTIGFTTYLTGFNNLDVTNVTSFAITGVTPGTTYYYRVRAYNAGGASANSNTITHTVLLDATTALAATAVTETSFVASWNPQGLATGYRIDVSTGADFSSYVVGYNNCDVRNVTTFAVVGLKPGTTYYYRVRPYTSASGGVSSNVIPVTTPATLSVTLTGTGGGSVHSDTGGIACISGSTADCSALYPGRTQVILGATADYQSFFKGWSGLCSGTGTCVVTMDDAKTVTATFNRITARIFDPQVPLNFDTLQAAYDATQDGTLIQLLAGELVGSFTAGKTINVAIAGGYDVTYTDPTQDTIITGTVTIALGQVILDRIVIR